MARKTLVLPFDGKRLRDARQTAKLSQNELAERATKASRGRITVSRFQIVRAEGGRYMPDGDVIAALIKALDLPLTDLLVPTAELEAAFAEAHEIRQESA